MNIFCPDIKFDRDTLVCIYNCKIAHRCVAYEKMYEAIKEQPIEEKYITKYGVPKFVVPDGIARKEKQRIKREKEQIKLLAQREKKLKKKQKQDEIKAKIKLKEDKAKAKAKLLKDKEDRKQARYKKLVDKWTPLLAEDIVIPTSDKGKATLIESIETPLKRKRRTKAEMEQARATAVPEADFTFCVAKPEVQENVVTVKLLKKRSSVYIPPVVHNTFFDDK
jgi:hypothetical protein